MKYRVQVRCCAIIPVLVSLDQNTRRSCLGRELARPEARLPLHSSAVRRGLSVHLRHRAGVVCTVLLSLKPPARAVGPGREDERPGKDRQG